MYSLYELRLNVNFAFIYYFFFKPFASPIIRFEQQIISPLVDYIMYVLFILPQIYKYMYNV
jgi:hypothetical protein